jgi:hypothetical protein
MKQVLGHLKITEKQKGSIEKRRKQSDSYTSSSPGGGEAEVTITVNQASLVTTD